MIVPLDQDLLAVYAALDNEIAAAAPSCRACGECCDFPKQGFTLFATTAEVELALRLGPGPGRWTNRQFCPFQAGGKCANRRCRPLGCRTYFCDAAFGDTGPVLYGRYHDAIKAAIDRHGHEYQYGPYLELLADAWER